VKSESEKLDPDHLRLELLQFAEQKNLHNVIDVISNKFLKQTQFI